MTLNIDDAKRLVQNYSQDSENYFRQLHTWLGTASAGGAIAMATLAAHLPNPNYAFAYLNVSFWFFLVGISSAGAAIFALGMRASAKGEHFASAHNRDSVNDAIRSIPQIISSPQSVADRANAERNKLINQSSIEHERAERAWRSQTRWSLAWAFALIFSCTAFVGGFSWPLVQMSFLNKQIVPAGERKTEPPSRVPDKPRSGGDPG